MMIYNDLKVTRKCRLFIAKEPLFPGPDLTAFTITKSDPIKKIFSDEYVHPFRYVSTVIETN